MRPVSEGGLLQNREEELAASHARVKLRAQRERHREAEGNAHAVLRNAVIVAGVAQHFGRATLAAADALRKNAVIAAPTKPIDRECETGGKP